MTENVRQCNPHLQSAVREQRTMIKKTWKMLILVYNCSLHSKKSLNEIMQTEEKVHRFLVISGIVVDAEKWKFCMLNCCIIHITSLLKLLFGISHFVVF